MRTAIALALFMVLGCADQPQLTQTPQTGDSYAVPGTYALATVGGTPLPAEYPPGLRITSSRLSIRFDGTWNEARSGTTAAGERSLGWAGTWTQTGSVVTLRIGSTPLYAGEATPSGFVLTSGGTIFAYSRE